MLDEQYVYFKCLEVQQPIGAFYVGAMPFGQVTFISYNDVRRIEARDVVAAEIGVPEVPGFLVLHDAVGPGF